MIDAVTLDEVNAVAHQLLTRPYGAAVLGPYRIEKVSAAAASGHRGLIGTVGAMNRLSRRSVLVGGLAVAGLAACSQKPVLADPAEPVPPIHDRIEALQRRHNAKIGVFAVDLDSGRTVAHLDGESFAMCSTFKGYAAARVLQMVEQRRVDAGSADRSSTPSGGAAQLAEDRAAMPAAR